MTVATLTRSGRLADGTDYGAVVPPNWNGTLLLDLDFLTAWQTPTYQALFALGYGGAGLQRNYTNPAGGQHIAPWVERTLLAAEAVGSACGKPERTIAWGMSRGGHVALATAQLHPEGIDGVIARGVYGGAATLMNQDLDLMFVLKALLAPGDPALPLVGISASAGSPAPAARDGALAAWAALLASATATSQGRARAALAAALAQLPDWVDATIPRPDPTDADAVQDGWLRNISARIAPMGTFAFMRPAFETSAGGNFAWNVGVDYAPLLTGRRGTIVETLYRRAGLDLQADLEAIAGAERIAPDPPAAWFLTNPSANFDGVFSVPVLTMMTIGDPLLPVSGLWALRHAAERAGCGDMLRMTFTEATGHCTFSVSENLAVVAALMRRLETGEWGPISPGAMNALAQAFGQDTARFIAYDLEPLGRAHLLGEPVPQAPHGRTREPA